MKQSFNKPLQDHDVQSLNQNGRTSSIIFRLFFGLLAICFLGACSSIPSVRPESPTVTVTAVTPVNLSLTDTKLNFSLRVSNPNDFNLPVRNLDFDAFFAGKKIAHGVSNEAVTIPANGEATMEIGVKAGLSKILKHVKTMFAEQDFNLNYGVKGKVKLANWPTRIPFNVERELDQASLLKGRLQNTEDGAL